MLRCEGNFASLSQCLFACSFVRSCPMDIVHVKKINNNLFYPISAHREMRTITNYFLLNLSIADLSMSSLNCMFNFIYMLNSDWPFGSFYCRVNNFMGNVTVATSVFTLVAISFDR